MIFKEWSDQDKAVGAYQAAVRSEARRLWLGLGTSFDFVDGMIAVINRHFKIAWNEGVAICGIKPDELSEAEIRARDDMIKSQFPFLFDFADFIEENSKANKGKLRTVFGRVDLWVNNYNSTAEKAKSMACADRKMEWVIDPAKANCRSCLVLNGKVKRNSFWRDRGIIPRNPPNGNLECGGWKCGCNLVPTDKPLSRGRLPNLP